MFVSVRPVRQWRKESRDDGMKETNRTFVSLAHFPMEVVHEVSLSKLWEQKSAARMSRLAKELSLQ